MTQMTVTVGLRFRWWVLPYLRLMDHLQRQCGVRLDPAKIHARLMKGTMIEINGKRRPLSP